jgi:muconolactone D-isomerase
LILGRRKAHGQHAQGHIGPSFGYIGDSYEVFIRRGMAEEELMAGKFLVIWKLELGRANPGVVRAVLRQQEYGDRLLAAGKLEVRYHLVGGHGGAWIYNVESNEELDNLLAEAPVYNMASYQVHALAEMRTPTLIGEAKPE